MSLRYDTYQSITYIIGLIKFLLEVLSAVLFRVKVGFVAIPYFNGVAWPVKEIFVSIYSPFKY